MRITPGDLALARQRLAGFGIKHEGNDAGHGVVVAVIAQREIKQHLAHAEDIGDAINTEIFLDIVFPVVGQHRALGAAAGNDQRVARKQALVATLQAGLRHLVEHARHCLYEHAFAT